MPPMPLSVRRHSRAGSRARRGRRARNELNTETRRDGAARDTKVFQYLFDTSLTFCKIGTCRLEFRVSRPRNPSSLNYSCKKASCMDSNSSRRPTGGSDAALFT
jgi:hypothetical protein